VIPRTFGAQSNTRAPKSPAVAARSVVLLLLAAVLALPAIAATKRGVPIRIDYPDPKPDGTITPIVIGGARYVSTNDLARVLSATKYWRPEIQKLSLRIGEHTIRFTVDAPVLLVDETSRNLVQPTRLIQGVVFVPESIVHWIFAWGLVTEATWDEDGRVIRFRAPVHSVRQAHLYPRGRVTEVSATLSRGVPPRVLYATASEVRVLFEAGTLDTARTFEGGVVVGGGIREVPGGVELRLRLSEDAKGYAISTASNRLKVSITDDKDLVEAGLFNALEPVPLGGPDRQVRTIVIDPGHGGADLGAPLPGGLPEKDAALDLARALRNALQQRLGGTRILLTRDGDTDLTAQRRAEFSNETGADLFISIHLDSEAGIRGGGFRVFSTAPQEPSDANRAPLPEDIDGLTLKPWLGGQMPVMGSSLALAQAVADSLSSAFPGTPVSLRTGSMRPLDAVVCPAILLESAPVSRGGADAAAHGYTIYDYTRTVADAVERFVKAARG
jgi:N-acetylmuramoyl-L-alanine amidase